MKKKALASIITLALLSAVSGTAAEAATPAKAGGICTKLGAVTMISAKSYTCVKALSGKFVWTDSSIAQGAKPQISGLAGGEGGDGAGPGEDPGRAGGVARQAALKKYNACLVSHGGTAILAPRGGDDGRPPRTPTAAPTPSLSAAQSKAVASCATLAPKFPPHGGDN